METSLGSGLIIAPYSALETLFQLIVAMGKRGPDKQPRNLSPRAMANLQGSMITGYRSITVRIYASEIAAKWFEEKTSRERGEIISNAKADH